MNQSLSFPILKRHNPTGYKPSLNPKYQTFPKSHLAFKRIYIPLHRIKWCGVSRFVLYLEMKKGIG